MEKIIKKLSFYKIFHTTNYRSENIEYTLWNAASESPNTQIIIIQKLLKNILKYIKKEIEDNIYVFAEKKNWLIQIIIILIRGHLWHSGRKSHEADDFWLSHVGKYNFKRVVWNSRQNFHKYSSLDINVN